MNAFTKNFENLADLQALGLEPVRNFSAIAADAFEKLARQNYTVAGDVLNFAVEQAKLPADVAEPKELIERQAETTKGFAELLNDRAREYVALGKEITDASAALFETPAPAKKTARSTKQKAA